MQILNAQNCVLHKASKRKTPSKSNIMSRKIFKENHEVKQMTCSAVEKISSLIIEYEKISHSSDSAKTIFHQTYDPVIEAFKNSTDILNEKSPSQPKKPKLGSSDDLSKSYNSDVPSTSGLPRRMNNESHSEGEGRRNEADDKVLIQYSYKTSKDFIPVFPLKGKPKYLDEWQNRKRNWPPTNVVTDIYNSEFFVVAKPALVEPSKDIDFCLACNIGEIKLAKAMTQLQRNVILIIKALQKSSLRDYTEILTTFHWKTVVYWVSEKTESHILENRTEETILIFLQNILAYMVDCLRENALQHYFVPSNLFADKHEDEIYDIVSKIAEIQENPIGICRFFQKTKH
ncbi:unnamed protein product [Mytilus edulis]|uniref:Mab-21-like HhH/H2TH-like domain-containing protein n=1 Tax=Mytilus edulis TaxID=6550 RepID=A0A8S3TEI1_MYTED|nr:unnamed protein product [Mytilus edulis]